MKRIGMMIILAALVCCAACAMAQDVTGLWLLDSAQLSGMTFTAEAVGIDASVELREDGTSEFNVGGQISSGTWTMEGEKISISESSAPVDFALVDGKLVSGDIGGVTLIFAQNEEEAAVDETTNLDGTWVFLRAEAQGMSFTAEELALDIYVMISGSTAQYQFSSEGQVILSGTADVIREGKTVKLDNGNGVGLVFEIINERTMRRDNASESGMISEYYMKVE